MSTWKHYVLGYSSKQKGFFYLVLISLYYKSKTGMKLHYYNVVKSGGE